MKITDQLPEGTIVVCINRDFDKLVDNKHYTIVREVNRHSDYIYIDCNNSNGNNYYNKHRFKTLEEYREQQLNKILDESR